MRDTDSHDTVAGLIGAWALDACSPEESELVRAHLGQCAACAREARVLREVAGELAGDHMRPPPRVEAVLRTAARGARRPAPAAPEYARPYAAQVAALDLMLDDLTAEEWRRLAAYGELTVHDLVAHLAATDSVVAAGLGLAVRPPMTPGTTLVARTAVVVGAARSRPVEETRRSWRAQAAELCGLLLREPSFATAKVAVGRPLPVPDVLVARAFETWVHGNDIAAATGRPAVLPLPEHLHAMADLAARALPFAIARRGTATGERCVRLHLTGAGGGTWTIPLAPGGPVGDPVAVLTVDIVEFCLLVGARREPDEVRAGIRGDDVPARELLRAAPALAPVP